MAVFSRIAGTGSALPAKILTNKDLEQFVDTGHVNTCPLKFRRHAGGHYELRLSCHCALQIFKNCPRRFAE